MTKGKGLGSVAIIALLLMLPAQAAETIPVPPTPPRDLETEVTAEGAVLLQWKPPVFSGSSPVTGYNVYADGELIATGLQALSFLDEEGIAAVYSVSASNEDLEGPSANEVAPRCVSFGPIGVSPHACRALVLSFVMDVLNQTPPSLSVGGSVDGIIMAPPVGDSFLGRLSVLRGFQTGPTSDLTWQ